MTLSYCLTFLKHYFIWELFLFSWMFPILMQFLPNSIILIPWLYMQSCKAFQIIHFLALLHRVYFSRIYWVIFIDTWLDSCLLFTLEPSMDKSCYLKQFSYWPMLQLLKVITFCCVTYLETLRRLIGYHATKILNSLELFTSLTSLPSIQSDLFFSPH